MSLFKKQKNKKEIPVRIDFILTLTSHFEPTCCNATLKMGRFKLHSAVQHTKRPTLSSLLLINMSVHHSCLMAFIKKKKICEVK